MAIDVGTDEALRLVADAVTDHHCILFLGAGIHAPPPAGSAFAYPPERRPPTGSALSTLLAESCNLANKFPEEDLTNLQRGALFYEIERSRHQLVDAVTDAVHVGKQPSAPLRALAALDFPLIITTNYDRLLENALSVAGKDPRVAVYTPRLEPTPDHHEPSSERPLVFKIHGDVSQPETIVITDEDYIQFVLRTSSKGRMTRSH